MSTLYSLHNILLTLTLILTLIATILELYYMIKRDYDTADFIGGIRSSFTTTLSVIVALSVLRM